ncbi:hypothetical protein [Streptomyces sp. NPDC058614]|uniref:hypothetical protein n=1 Tax=Streptomyces sp. NPDC058614 TaxID=3346557 RepID=UPI0036466E24
MRMLARQRCHTALAGLVTLATAAVLTVSATAPAAAADTWTEVGSDRADPLSESQGLTSVEVPAGSPNRYTGVGTIPIDVYSRGWNHVGDPDASYSGYYVEPYQADGGTAKMFRVQAPGGGAWSEYVHQLNSGEALNNSWVAISPSGSYMVNGEYGTMTRFLVFPTPAVNSSTSPSANLPLASTINLDHAVRDVQGCDFVTSTQLLCSSDDPAGTLFGYTKPLLQIDLSAEPGSSNVTGHVTALRQLPLRSGCTGTFEAEGIDYDRRTGTLRVIVISPGFCVLTDSKTYKFTKS